MPGDITYQIMEAYGNLKADEAWLRTAIRLNNTTEIFNSAMQLADFTIPSFRRAVPAEIRRKLDAGNEQYLQKLESDAKKYLSR